ncbi:sun domain containing protein [Niveomyces insectorum RCEF 264]|uniref:Sun domain containing protein n=1 Tax=Niveomyces insectorum RCEF 264 TaxID=1081102 RepID=A0A162LCF0_9HYPO|nr:sun domain containing protein [Niveomyces insectorum RCEF 264]
MKTIVKMAVTAALMAGASADLSNRHQHLHRHRAVNEQQRRDSPVEKRAAAVTAWANPVETKYVYAGGEAVGVDEAKKCIADGQCIVVGATTPTFTPPPPPPPPTTTPKTTSTSRTKEAAEFIESKKPAAPPTTTAQPATQPTQHSTPAAPASNSPAANTNNNGGGSGGSGASSDFPSGQIPCSQFPSAYGAVAVDWVGLDGWASIQTTGSWSPGTLISDITEPVSGGCVPGSFCSYACAPGQTKTQWPPTSQGATGQSIGGLWCNSNGFLELTNPAFSTLCMAGLGGITVQNQLSDVACVCGTNYPGNEMMNVPLVTEPGQAYPLTNLNAKTAYQWQGKYTSGQFYVNNAGVTVDEACVWTSSQYPDSAGNWAPVNIGAGTDINGVTYLSIFANQPTSTAQLDFDIEITGDVSAPCYLKSGSYYGGGNGCTTAITSGGSATIVFKASGSS